MIPVLRLIMVCLVFSVALTPLQAVSQEQPTTETATTATTAEALPEVALDSKEIYEKSFKALTMLLVAAVLIENALAVLFNWRVFLTYFSLRGAKTVIAVVVSYVVVTAFDIDIVGELLDAYVDHSKGSDTVSVILTALILSGGSSGVNNLMVALGYRTQGRDEEINPTVPESKAWIAVRVKRIKAIGPVHVHVTEIPPPTPEPGAIAGTIGFRRPSLLELLLRNTNRFPANGGHEVEPGKFYKIEVVGYDAQRQQLPDRISDRPYRFAPKAVVNFEVTL